MHDVLAAVGILVVAIAIAVLGWERGPRPLLRDTKARERGIKGLLSGLNNRIEARLRTHVGGSLPAGVSSQRWLAVVLAAMSLAILILLWMGFGGISLVGGGVAGYVAATAYANAAAKKRQKRLDDQILRVTEIQRDVLRKVDNAEALGILIDAAEGVGPPFSEELQDLTVMPLAGERISGAIEELQSRVFASGSNLLVQYLATHREMYRPTEEGRISPHRQAEMLDGFYEQSTHEEDLRRRVDVLASPGRTTRWLVVAIIVGILVFQFVFQPDAMRYFISTAIGQVSMVIVFGLIFLVIVLGERFAKVD